MAQNIYIIRFFDEIQAKMVFNVDSHDINIERSIEFVIKVGAGTETVGLFESIHLLYSREQ
jgi:hypothetical protein